jgi:serine/threonine-protein kinase
LGGGEFIAQGICPMSFSARDVLAGVLAVQRGLMSPQDLAQWLATGRSPAERLPDVWAAISDDAQHQLDAVSTEPQAPHTVGPAPAPAVLHTLPEPRVREEGSCETLVPGDPQTPSPSPPSSNTDNFSELARTVTRASERESSETLVSGGRPMSRPRRPGSHTDRFHRLSLHAKGGLGAVYLARDEELGRTVALKEILEHHADQPSSRARFTFEAEVTGQLEHPGIVPVYGLGCHADGRPYYAMRFIQGESLENAVRRFHKADARGRDPAERALTLRGLLRRFVDVCNAISFAHARGVIHRDIKPANVMLGEFGETLVVDWGLAKQTKDSASGADASPAGAVSAESPPVQSDHSPYLSTGTMEGTAVGTPAYMPPEQAQGQQSKMGPRSDVYALGATLYYLLTGKHPVQAKHLQDVLDKVIRGEVEPIRKVNPGLPKALEAVCAKAMAREPEARYASAKELAQEIERWLADEPVGVRREPPVERLFRWVRRHHTWVLSLGTAVLLGLAVMAVAVVLLTAAKERERQARERAEAAEHAERQAREQAQADYERAEAAFRTAMEAVDTSFTRISEEALLNQPGMQGLRRALLDDALKYYRRFLTERRDDLSVREQYAGACFREGRILELTGNPAEAVPSYEEAIKIQRELVDQEATCARLTALGDTLNALGRVSHKAFRLDDALKFYQEAAAVRGRAAALAPNDAEAGRRLANTVMNLGLVHKDKGNPTEARQRLDEAQALRAKFLAKQRSIPLVRDHAMGSYNLALLLFSLNEPEAAERSFKAALDGFEEVVAAEPNDMNARLLLSICGRLTGDLAASGGHDEEAQKWHARARKELEVLVARNPDVPDYQLNLAGLILNVADRHLRNDQLDAAAGEFRAAVELLERLLSKHKLAPASRDLAVALRGQAEVLARREKPAEALVLLRRAQRILEDLVKQYPGNADMAAQLAETRKQIAKISSF